MIHTLAKTQHKAPSLQFLTSAPNFSGQLNSLTRFFQAPGQGTLCNILRGHLSDLFYVFVTYKV